MKLKNTEGKGDGERLDPSDDATIHNVNLQTGAILTDFADDPT